MNEKLAAIYHQYNPWWEGKDIPSKYRFPFKRELFNKINKLAQKGDSTILIGPRRVGKTVLLYQFVQSLLEGGFEPRRIFFLAGDDPSLVIREHPVSDAISFLEEFVFKKSLRELGGRFYLIFDEIQGIKRWAEYFKKFLDLGYPVCFLASGSSSIKMVKTTRESLVGRATEILTLPFSFREFLRLKYGLDPPAAEPFDLLNPDDYAARLDSVYREGLDRIETIGKAMNAYFIFGGFPETYTMPENEAADYLKNQVVERVLFRDIPEVIELKNPYLLQQLFNFVSSETANIASFANLCSRFAARYETVSAYLLYLESAFLINILKKYSRGGMAPARSWPKVHIQDPAVANAMMNLGDQLFARPDIQGRITEGIVVSALKNTGASLFYWRERDKEVDIVLSRGDRILPIEVKYTSRPAGGREISGIKSLKTKYKFSRALVITRDKYDLQGEIIYIPLWLFLLLNLQ